MKTDLDEAFSGTCAQCGRENVKVRRIEAKGLFGESRGFFDICFNCMRPVIYVKARGGRIVKSPMRDEQIEELRKKGKLA